MTKDIEQGLTKLISYHLSEIKDVFGNHVLAVFKCDDIAKTISQECATFMHTHLSESHEKEIAELKDENEKFSKGWDKSIETSERAILIIDQKDAQLKSLTEQHQQEIERLKGVLEKMFKAIDQTIRQYNGEFPEEYEVSFLYPANNKAFQMLVESHKNYKALNP